MNKSIKGIETKSKELIIGKKKPSTVIIKGTKSNVLFFKDSMAISSFENSSFKKCSLFVAYLHCKQANKYAAKTFK